MAALQRFKVLLLVATQSQSQSQCTAAPPPSPSPSRSPAAPCFRLHRRQHGRRRRHPNSNTKTKTLRRLISSPDRDPFPIDQEEQKGLLRDNSRTLRDLFVSSPKAKTTEHVPCAGASAAGRAGPVAGGRGGGWRFVGIRNRLLRPTWRPVLLAIPE